MSCCKNYCVEESFKCMCRKRPHENCRCRDRECKCSQKLAKDCVCVEWSVLNGETQTVFQTGGFRHIFASGFIGYDSGRSDSVIVRFFYENNQVGSAIRVFRDSSVAFSFTRFDRITVQCLTTGGDVTDVCEGDICITTRVPIF